MKVQQRHSLKAPSKAAATAPVAPRPARVAKAEGFEAPQGPANDNRLEGSAKTQALIPNRFSYPEAAPPWDVVKRLPAAERDRLSFPEQEMISKVLAELQQSARQQGLSYVPVFGYLSLRRDNHRELGLSSQAEVVPGQHTVEARLSGHSIGVVASTVYRGTPEHPGIVAGLAASDGASTPGTVLKLPLDRAEELLTRVFHREYFAEDDLRGDKAQAMYRPVVREVQTQDGQTVKALVFITNPDSAKDIDPGQKLTPSQLAWFMGAQGGFRAPEGRRGGGAFDYWNGSAALKPNKVLQEAVRLANWVPSPETVDYLSKNASSDPRAMKALEVVLELFQGAYVPLSLKAQQRDAQALERAPEWKKADVDAEVERYLRLSRD